MANDEHILLRTDDSVRRVRAMWLGSGAWRWPVDWTFVEWGIAAGCGALVVPPSVLLVWLVLGPIGGLVLGLGAGVFIARAMFQFVRREVSADQPVRWWRTVVRSELRGGRQAPTTQIMTVTATWVVPATDEDRAAVSSRSRWRRRRARRRLENGAPRRLEVLR